MHKDPIEFDKECRRLINNIYAFDVLRSDKCTSSHGLELQPLWIERVNNYWHHPTFNVILQMVAEKHLRTVFSKNS